MAITIVGTRQIQSALNGADVTLTFDGTPAQNDVVILVGGHSQNDATEAFGPNTADYVEIWKSAGNGGAERAFGAWYKILGASPDATVQGEGGADSSDGVVYASVVLRGVDTSNPMDATRVTAGPTASTNPDPGSIVTVTNGAWVVVAAASGVNDASVTAPSGYTNSGNANANDTNAYTLGIATIEKATAGTENPPSWTGWSTGTWKAVTIAVRPAAVVQDGEATGSITWAGAATGTSVHSGAATGSITWAGSATGEAPADVMEGAATGSITWAGSATGTTTRSGASTGTITWAGAANGTNVHSGSSTGTITWAGVSTGTADREGAATGSITWAGSANGESPAPGVQEGSAEGTITWAGSATGATVHAGAASGTITWVGSVTGQSVHQGPATGAITWVGGATGEETRHTFWEPDPVGYTPALVGYTPAPVAYVPRDPEG